MNGPVRRLELPRPARADSRAEYVARMHRVVQHIDDHVDEQLDLDALARVANFSPFHFHRLFTAWMGETLASTRDVAGWRSRPTPGRPAARAGAAGRAVGWIQLE